MTTHPELQGKIDQLADAREQHRQDLAALDRAVDNHEADAKELAALSEQIETSLAQNVARAFKANVEPVADPETIAAIKRKDDIQARISATLGAINILSDSVEFTEKRVHSAEAALTKALEPTEGARAIALAQKVERCQADLADALLELSAFARSGPTPLKFPPQAISALKQTSFPTRGTAAGNRWEQCQADATAWRKSLRKRKAGSLEADRPRAPFHHYVDLDGQLSA